MLNKKLDVSMKNTLKNKFIVLGVTGSIAAYKSALLARELVKLGAEVHVIMTKSATEFITPLTLANLTRNKVIIDMFDEESQTSGAWHIELAHKADVMLIAPCSATTIAKLANGICDNPLITVATALPRNIPLIISPAMDSTMWLHPSTQRNIEQFKKDGGFVIPPEEGELSSGLVGPGRFPDMNTIIEALESVLSGWIPSEKEVKKPDAAKFKDKPLETLQETVDKVQFNADLELTKLKKKMSGIDFKKLQGKKVLITAGPTHEKIDDVRYITNYSSGKMGFALAQAAEYCGAHVTLITGPVHLETPENVKRINVLTADEMFDHAINEFEKADVAILSAAVSDYKPLNKQDGKMKKSKTGLQFNLELESTRDILATLGKMKKGGQILVGFALEAENELQYGKEKLAAKNCDMIVINSANMPQSGFGGDDNTITIVQKNKEPESYPPMSKKSCAEVIIKKIVDYKK